MSMTPRSTKLYPHPFSKGYWRDAAAELKDVKMLVITALMIALRIALKPFAIYIGPQMAIQTATLATALGAMIFGPVVAIPAAMISDTIGFMIFPTGDYFLPFVLTEIASTMIYALFLYRAKPSPVRVMLTRFCICFFVNIILQTCIFAWQYAFMGNPEQAKNQVLGIFTVARIFKNLCMFPIESVVLTLFLSAVIPVTQRAKLTYCANVKMRFTGRQLVLLALLVVLGAASATGYLGYRYSGTSRSADYTIEQRVAHNKEMAALVTEQTDTWDEATVFCVVDSAYRGLFEKETAYTVSVYVLDLEAFQAGCAADSTYSENTLWAYSKSGPTKDKYQSLIKVAEFTATGVEKTGELKDFQLKNP